MSHPRSVQPPEEGHARLQGRVIDFATGRCVTRQLGRRSLYGRVLKGRRDYVRAGGLDGTIAVVMTGHAADIVESGGEEQRRLAALTKLARGGRGYAFFYSLSLVREDFNISKITRSSAGPHTAHCPLTT